MNKKQLVELLFKAYGEASAFRRLNSEAEEPLELYHDLIAAKQTGLQLEETIRAAILEARTED